MARLAKSQKVILRVAFIMPVTVKEFVVRCPQAAGRARVSKPLKTANPPPPPSAPKGQPSNPNNRNSNIPI
jgi:hypothetical protein